ncbi:MAG: phenylacetate--CoA ligase family protein [Candidatus Neomarinimicrobiota bacterium]
MKLSGYDIDNATNFINSYQDWSLEKKLQWQKYSRWDIVKYHYNNNNCYHNKINGNLPNKWEELPIMKKEDYQINMDELLSDGYSINNTYIANTSGSTGKPFFYAKNKDAHAMTWALTENRYNWHNISLESKQARYFGSPLENRGKYYELLKDLIMNRKKMLIFDLSDNALAKHINSFAKIKFDFVYGYTNALVLFARYLLKNNIILNHICPTLKICITTSEVLSIEDRRILSSAFGVKIVNEYGVSEAGGVTAIEDENANWILSNETQYIEIVDDEGCLLDIGKEGKILITDLHNQAMPFIRYEVGDTGILNLNNSIGKVLLSNLTGRTNDTIKLPSGKKSPGLTFYYISRSILESSGILKEFIIRQVSLDTFIFDIISDRPLNTDEIQQIENRMNIYLEPGLKLKINRLKNIKRPNSGKLKHFISEIDE